MSGKYPAPGYRPGGGSSGYQGGSGSTGSMGPLDPNSNLAAALREGEARPKRSAPGRPPRMTRGGAALGAVLRATQNPVKPPLVGDLPGKFLGMLPKALPLLKNVNPFFRALGFLNDFGPVLWPTTQPEPAHYDLTHFNKICGGPNPKHDFVRFSTTTGSVLCGTPGQVPTGPYGMPLVATNSAMRQMAFGISMGANRMRFDEIWQRPSSPTMTLAPPWIEEKPGLGVLPNAYQAPAPLPYPLIPMRAPSPERGYGESKEIAGERPRQVETKPGPSGPITIIKPPKVVNRPPEKGVKEKKGQFTPHGKEWLGWGLGMITEGADLVNAIYDALPCKLRGGSMRVSPYGGKYCHIPNWNKKSQHQKALFLLKNLDKLDLDKAIENIVLNQIEDKIFGKLGAGAAKAASRAYLNGYLPRGNLGTGPAI